MAKSVALVLSSGGLHSLVAAGIAAREYRIAILHVQETIVDTAPSARVEVVVTCFETSW